MEWTGDAAVERAQMVTGIRLSRMEVSHRGAFGSLPLSSEVSIEHIPATGVRIVVKYLPFVHLHITQCGPCVGDNLGCCETVLVHQGINCGVMKRKETWHAVSYCSFGVQA